MFACKHANGHSTIARSLQPWTATAGLFVCSHEHQCIAVIMFTQWHAEVSACKLMQVSAYTSKQMDEVFKLQFLPLSAF